MIIATILAAIIATAPQTAVVDVEAASVQIDDGAPTTYENLAKLTFSTPMWVAIGYLKHDALRDASDRHRPFRLIRLGTHVWACDITPPDEIVPCVYLGSQ